MTSEAWADYQRAALGARVAVRELTGEESADAAAVLVAVWGEPAPMSAALLTAFEHAGNYVAGAFAGGRMVGVTSGFFGAPASASMHSHVAAVLPGTGAKGIGTAMKLHQRWWCLERGAAAMTWTFDPLIARNAAFNVRRLGATLAEYKPNFYGEMTDGINAGQGSDRMLVRWDLAAPLPEAPREVPADAPVALGIGPDGGPMPGAGWEGGTVGVVRVPQDIESMRAERPKLAKAWRIAVRETMLAMWEAGMRPAAVGRDGSYLMEKP